MPRNLPRALIAAACLAAATGTLAQTAQIPISVDATTGTLQVGAGAPGSSNLKLEVGPSPGQVRVINNASGLVQAFAGIRGIRLATGAGFDEIEFDINASQSLALDLSTGSGDAKVKIQWKVPPGAAATTSSLTMASGGGNVEVELGFESETRTSTFAWNTDFGGGNKLIKAGFAFKPGTQVARKNVVFGNLGGGQHQVLIDIDNDATDARLTLDSGFAQDVLYKVVSDAPTTRLDVDTRVFGARQAVEIVSAAPATNLWLRGGTANSNSAETKYSLAHLVGGLVTSNFDFTTAGFGSKFEAKFDGSASQLRIGGRLLGSLGDDEIKVERNMVANTTLLLDCRSGIDSAIAPAATVLGCESFARN